MKPPAAVVQSVFDFAIREINALEGRIDKAETDADAMLWEQARQVVAQLDAGLSLRKLAAQWINTKTGKPYDKHHVSFVRQVFEGSGELTPRPRFREAYNAIANVSVNPRDAALTALTNPDPAEGPQGRPLAEKLADLEWARERSRQIKQLRAEHPEQFAADEIFEVLNFAVDESETWARHLKLSEWPGKKTAADWHRLAQRLVTVTAAVNVLVKPS